MTEPATEQAAEQATEPVAGPLPGAETEPEAEAPTQPLPAVQLPAGAMTGGLRSWAGLSISLGLWALALATTNLAGLPTAGLGLLAVLPVAYWAAVGVLMVSFALTVVRRPARRLVLAAHTAAMIAILHATPAILYGTLRYSWTWKHIGIIDFITHNGVVFNLGGVLGPYQGWPGFFSLNSFLTSASGSASAASYAQWVLPVNDLLWLGPVILIARAFSTDHRLVWTSAWLFTLGNWIGQDYFSPQAFSYFLYLTIIAVCLRWLRPAPSPVGRGERRVLILCLLPMMAAIASSHQLTPFILITALTVLAVFRQTRPRWLLAASAIVLTLGWLGYGARDWLEANRSRLLQGFGGLWTNASGHIVSQGSVPASQGIIDWTSRSLSAALVILAILGYRRHWLHKHLVSPRSPLYQEHVSQRSWVPIALLAMAGLPALAANSYGGEIAFRVFLFGVPFLAIAAAALFFPDLNSPARRLLPGLALAGTLIALSAGYAVSNFGQEAANYFTPQEVAASTWLYNTAPPGSVVIAPDSDFPWAFEHYNWYRYTFLDGLPAKDEQAFLTAPVQRIAAYMKHGPAYLILTQSQQAQIKAHGTWPSGEFAQISQGLAVSSKFIVVYHNADVTIYQLAGG